MAQLRKSSNLSPQLMEVREPWQNSCWPVGTSGLFGTKARRDSRFHVKVSQSSTNKHDLCNTSIWSLPVAKMSDSLGTWPDFCVWQLELCNFQSELLLFILKVYHRDTYIFFSFKYLLISYLCVCVYVSTHMYGNTYESQKPTFCISSQVSSGCLTQASLHHWGLHYVG